MRGSHINLIFLVNLLTQWKAMLSQWDCYYIAYSKIYGKLDSELQSAPFKIWLVVTLAETATESEAPHILVRVAFY